MYSLITRTARRMRQNRELELFSRMGFATNGLFHGLIGLAMITFAFGSHSEIDQSGVLLPLAQTWFGRILLILIAAGLVSLGVWQVTRALVLRREPHQKRKWHRQANELIKAVAYLVLGISSFTFLFVGASGESSAHATKTAAARLLGMPGGSALLFLLGVTIALVGAYFIYRGVAQRFVKTLDPKKLGHKKTLAVLGTVGYTAKGIAFLLVGALICQSALLVDPERATGLDGAIRSLAALPVGSICLLLLGAGFIVYGVYSVIRGKYAKV